ncbi:MAG TPA: hypothetical protein VIS10_17915 [Anaerolineales bacterium]
MCTKKQRLNWNCGWILILLALASTACASQTGDVSIAEHATAQEITPKFAETPRDNNVPEALVDKVDESSCKGKFPSLSTGFDIQQAPSMDEPPAKVPFRDSVFGTCMMRLTDRFEDLTSEDPSQGLKNEYSRVQSFNADGSRVLVRSIDAYWYVYDAQILKPMEHIPLSVEPRWDAEDPDLLYHIDETRLLAYRLSTAEERLVHDFAVDFPGQDLAAVWTRYEGSPSFDGRYWGFMAEDQEWLATALLVYDLKIDRVVARRDLPSRPEIDSVSISPLGGFFLAYYDGYCEPGQLGSDAHPCGLMVYDRDLQNGRGLLRIVGHSDLALDANQREVLIFQDIDTDNISLLDLESGEVTPLWPIDFSHSALGLHFSGRASRMPGWALVSTYNGAQPAATWMDDQIFVVELKPGGRVVRLVHTYSIVDENQEHDYWAEPHASVNHDFTRIVFTSNWGRSGTGEVETYLIELPPDWLSQLP